MEQNKKGNIAVTTIIIVIVAITAGIIGWMFAKKSQAPISQPTIQPITQETASGTKAIEKIDTSNWELYQNIKFGYEIKYPDDWEIGTLNNVPAKDFSAPYFAPKSSEKIHPNLMVGNIHKIDAGETVETGIPLGAGSDYKLIDKKLIKVGGKDAALVEYFQSGYGRKNGQTGMVRQQIKVINGDISYLISLDEENEDINVLDSSKLWEKTAIFQAMLDSFRFLETNYMDASSQEIIYSNSKYQFSLKLPVTWQGYKVSEMGNDGTLCFSIPKSGSQSFCIFQLYVLSKNEPISSSLKLVGQTSNWKIVTEKSNSCVQLDNFQCERSEEVPEILKTLKAE
jgi:hypothetical protein